MMRKLQAFFASLLCAAVLSGCTTVRPNQKWPMLPQYPRPEVPKVSKVELMEAIDKLPPSEARERVKLLATEVIDDLAEAFLDFSFWGDRMDAVIEQYNEEAEKHNKRVVSAGDSGLLTPGAVESHIVGDFNGLDHGHIYELANGQMWQQTEYWIWYWYSIWPNVLIWEENGVHKMKVEGIGHAVTVARIR